MKERDRQIESLFQSVLDQPSNQREQFLSEQATGDADLLQEVNALLSHYSIAQDTFLGTPAHGLIAASTETDELPKQIGKYQVIGKLGEGGMGVVYRARQENPSREVAVKLIRAGLTGASMIRRFEYEASILGRLQHPSIAHILEAGMSDDELGKRPFFAMELVDGIELTTFVKNAELDTKRRLKLLVKICDAVHHAHQKGVVHRDLKPANILVATEQKGDANALNPTPKILDFGVAKSISEEGSPNTMHTMAGQVIGTLAYMSPEQLEGNSLGVDARTDIYALGVLLYELLVDKLPFDVNGMALAKAAQIISDEEPPSLGSINRSLKGDLNTIVMKALEKDPAHRYQSAVELSSDIRFFLSNKPITARPMTTMYQVRKFARRNRGLVAGVSSTFLMLIVGVVVSLFFAVGQSRALEESERQRQMAQAVNDFLNKDLLANASPKHEANRSVTLREILDRASTNISTQFTDEPYVEATIRTTLADTYKSLGEYEEARTHAEIAVALLQKSGDMYLRQSLYAMNRQASLEELMGHTEKAENLFRAALEKATPLYGEEDSLTLTILNNLALLLNQDGRYEDSLVMLETLVEKRTKILGLEHPRTMISMNNLALAYLSLGRFDDAIRMHEQEANLCKKVQGMEHPGTLISFNNLAVAYLRKDNFEQAEVIVRDVLEVRQRVLGPTHPITLESVDTLAVILANLKRYDQAIPLATENMNQATEALGSDHPMTLHTQNRLARIYYAAKQLDQAEAATMVYLQNISRVRGEDNFRTALAMLQLGEIYLDLEKYEQAQSYGQQGVSILEKKYAPDHEHLKRANKLLADIQKNSTASQTKPED